MFTPVHTCSHMFTPVHTCSHLFTLVHTCSHLFTPQWLSTFQNLPGPVRTCPQYSDAIRCLRHAFFCTFECSYSSVLRPVLLKLHILTHLIESFPTVYGMWSCIEIEMSIPLGAHALKALNRKSFEHGNFLVLHPALLKIAHFNSVNRQLSIAVLPKELRQRKIVDPSRGAP